MLMKTPVHPAAKILFDAADLIETHGFTVGVFIEPNGSMCAQGAMVAAVIGYDVLIEDQHPHGMDGWSQSILRELIPDLIKANPALAEAYQHMVNLAHERFPHLKIKKNLGDETYLHVGEWNNQLSEQEVLKGLRDTANKIQEKSLELA